MREPYKVGSDGGIFFVRFASALFFVAAVMVLLFGSGDFIGSLDKFFDLAIREFDYSDVWQIPEDMQIWIDGVIVGRYRHYFIFTLSAILMLVLSLVQFILPFFIGKNRLAYRKYWVIQMVLCVITFMCAGLFVCSGIIVCVIRNVSNSMLFGIIPLVLTFIGVILEGCAVAALLHNYDFEGEKG